MKKKWTWKTWLMASLLMLLFVVAGVGVVVGVVTHTEPGLAHPENSWDHTPITVTCRGYVPADDEACRVARATVSTLNSRLGLNLLLWVPMGTWRAMNGMAEGDIHITMRAPVSEGLCSAPGECFELTGTQNTYTSCTMQTMNASGAGDLEGLTVYHGLGHCLGLAHDDYQQSIMQPMQRRTHDRDFPPWISDFDQSLLRGKYGR